MTPNTCDSRTNSRRTLAGLTFVNACLLGATAWIAFSQGGSFVAHADAAPPPSSRNIEQAEQRATPAGAAVDPAQQRLEMTGELRALRNEVAELKAILTSGRIKAEITNLDKIEQGEVKLEIDYAKLRDALRAQ
ncbi:MAG: hypothetical protein ACKO0W_10345 [Planctomycetota bacterium]